MLFHVGVGNGAACVKEDGVGVTGGYHVKVGCGLNVVVGGWGTNVVVAGKNVVAVVDGLYVVCTVGAGGHGKGTLGSTMHFVVGCGGGYHELVVGVGVK